MCMYASGRVKGIAMDGWDEVDINPINNSRLHYLLATRFRSRPSSSMSISSEVICTRLIFELWGRKFRVRRLP